MSPVPFWISFRQRARLDSETLLHLRASSGSDIFGFWRMMSFARSFSCSEKVGTPRVTRSTSQLLMPCIRTLHGLLLCRKCGRVRLPCAISERLALRIAPASRLPLVSPAPAARNRSPRRTVASPCRTAKRTVRARSDRYTMNASCAISSVRSLIK